MKKIIIPIISAIFLLSTFAYSIAGFESENITSLSAKNKEESNASISSDLKIDDEHIISKSVKDNKITEKQDAKPHFCIKKNNSVNSNITKPKETKKKIKNIQKNCNTSAKPSTSKTTTTNTKSTTDKKYDFILKLCNSGNDVLRRVNKLTCLSEGPQFSEMRNDGSKFVYSALPAPFDTLKSFDSELSPYFTKNYLSNLKNSRFFREVDGQTYFLLGQPGMKYVYEYLNVLKVEDKGDIIEAICNTEIKYDKEYPAKVTLKKENGSYKIDSFESILD